MPPCRRARDSVDGDGHRLAPGEIAATLAVILIASIHPIRRRRRSCCCDTFRAYAPLVWQCRYSGIEVPDALWTYCSTGKDRPYSNNQVEDMVRESGFMNAFDAWTDRFAAFVCAKGKVEPGRWRAYGYEPPGHRWADVKLAWRDARMRVGRAPDGSSPRTQEALGLNQDAVLSSAKSEGERLREELIPVLESRRP